MWSMKNTHWNKNKKPKALFIILGSSKHDGGGGGDDDDETVKRPGAGELKSDAIVLLDVNEGHWYATNFMLLHYWILQSGNICSTHLA